MAYQKAVDEAVYCAMQMILAQTDAREDDAKESLIEALGGVPRAEHERGVCWHGDHMHRCSRRADAAEGRASALEHGLAACHSEADRLRDERDRYYEAICDTLQHPGDGRAVFRRLRAALYAEDGSA